jgi:hypothetical protein
MKRHVDTIERDFDLEVHSSGLRGLTLHVITIMENGTFTFPKIASMKVKNEARLASSRSDLSTLSFFQFK